jgi:ammonia channel protein AmtB
VVTTLIAQGQVFPEQVTTGQLAQNIVYATGTVGALSILAGLLLVDMGGVRRVNQFDSAIQKLIGFFIGFATYFLIGFAIWNWQYYVAFDVANPYWQAIKDWWLGGALAGELAQRADPEVAPGLNNQQIFIFFLACFAGLINVLIHLSVTERIKAAAFYVISFVAAIVSSLLSWLTWGSTGPITNLGYHDFFGSGFVYVFAGAMGLVLAMRVGQRPGMYAPHPRLPEYRSYNLGLTVVGVVLVFAGLPMVILSCGFFFDPQALFVSVTMADTSIGIAFNNLGLSWAGGALTGALIAYRTRKYIYTLLGPFAGYVSGAPAFDVYEPWQMFLVALFAPLVAYGVYEWTQRRGLDEHKLVPLFLGVGSYGILMTGLVDWGTPQSGYFGVESGDYAFQHAEMNVGWQALGLVVCIGAGLLTALALATVLERTIGLRVSDEDQVVGFDARDWDLVHDIEPLPVEAAAPGEGTAAAAGTPGDGADSGSVRTVT